MSLNQIQLKNDEFRRNLIENYQNSSSTPRVFFAPGFTGYYETDQPLFYKVLQTIIGLGEEHFNEDNDPHQEHDMAFVDVMGEKFFFKIDYYDSTFTSFAGAENLLDDSKCFRVLTVGHSSDY